MHLTKVEINNVNAVYLFTKCWTHSHKTFYDVLYLISNFSLEKLRQKFVSSQRNGQPGNIDHKEYNWNIQKEINFFLESVES